MDARPDGEGTLTKLLWLGRDSLKLLYAPLTVAGGLLDTFRAWKNSRSWLTIAITAPGVIALLAILIVYGASLLTRADRNLQMFATDSEAKCSTELLERLSNRLVENQLTEITHDIPWRVEVFGEEQASKQTLRYVQLLSHRILGIEPTNSSAIYRLGLALSADQQTEEARKVMEPLANGALGDFFEANEWMAKQLLLDRIKGETVDAKAFENHLKRASQKKGADYRLLSMYSRVLEAGGNIQKALEIAKMAAASKTELNLDLARLYGRLNDADNLRNSAFIVEDYFKRRLNTSTETDQDRLAVAEAMVLTKRLDKAIEVLDQGLAGGSRRPKISLQLSETKRMLYVDSIKTDETGKQSANLELLEAAALADPMNPRVANEVANLLPRKIKPSKMLLELLKNQIAAGATTWQTHMVLAEAYYGMGNINESIRQWEMALDRNPNNLEALNNMAICMARLNPSELEKPLELLSNASKMMPSNPELLDSYGEVLVLANRPKEAIIKYEMAIRQDGKRIDTRKRLVEAYQMVGMKELAKAQQTVIDAMEKAAAIDESTTKSTTE